MEMSERSFLLENFYFSNRAVNSGLSVWFAIICVVDVFGVFPIVALPKFIIDCGYMGIVLVILVCSTQVYTAVLLGKCWIIAEGVEPAIRFKNRYPYSALAELAFGGVWAKFVTFLINMAVFTGGIPNLIVASQNLQFLGLQLSGYLFNISFCYWMLILGIIMCPFLWLGSPKDMKVLCTISATLVLLVFILLFSCILSDSTGAIVEESETEKPLFIWENLFTAYGILSFQFDIHPTILTIQIDMNDKTKIHNAILGGFFVTLVLFCTTSIALWLRYGMLLGANILNVLPSTPMLHLVAVSVALQLSLSTAINTNTLYQHLEDCLGIPRDFNHKRCIVRSILAMLSVFVAECVPRFDLVMSLIGGVLTGPLVFILPPLFYIKMLSLKRKHEQITALESVQNIISNARESPITIINNTISEKNQVLSNVKFVFCMVIIVLSILAIIGTTYWNIVISFQYLTFLPICIINANNATF